jgi:hypothetical protein
VVVGQTAGDNAARLSEHAMSKEDHEMASRMLHVLVDSALLIDPVLRREHVRRLALELAEAAIGTKRPANVAALAHHLGDAAVALLDAIELSGGEVGHA